ncbi:MAG: ABC transporter permease subunit [Gammaproteobacteria bacterium]|jgi:oligopeptide transport system permease protein|nr:ABC transporter permease subunit [Gammaproteobacteria bacterium]
MAIIDPTAEQRAEGIEPEIRGRSLWANAWARLLGNKAAVGSGILLGVVALLALLGPWLSPHPYDAIYQSYIKVPPSLEAYPREAEIPGMAERALRRTGAEIEALDLDGTTLTLTLVGERELDPRLTRGLDRTDDFTDVAILDQSADGRQMTVQATVERYHFFFGTDSNGRDLMTRVFYGARISLMIGILATLVSLVIGVTYGATAGYLGGRIDDVMMRIVDVLYSIPFMFFVILLMVFFGRNIFLMFVAVGAVEWLDMARIVRGQTLSVKRREFIEAAHACGVRSSKIIRRHIVPNTLGPVVVYMTLMVPKVILLESFLSFLGLGVQEPMTSWGVLIADGANNIVGATWMLVFPAIFLAVTLFCLNFIGDGLRDALDPKDR